MKDILKKRSGKKNAIVTSAKLPKGVTLIDGAERNREHPKTFTIPENEDIEHLMVEDYVKIGVDIDPPVDSQLSGERFWVKLIEIDGDVLVGQIDNDPMVCGDVHGLEGGMLIQFERKHILCITTKKEIEDHNRATNFN